MWARSACCGLTVLRPPPGYGVKGVCGGFAPSLTACPSHASRKNLSRYAASIYSNFYLVSI
ncbi:MAG: hypothetical protein NZ455_10985 [Bacteroidia bacterium]|nr:hypothetical protein [Bacteroidia bacterium]